MKEDKNVTLEEEQKNNHPILKKIIISLIVIIILLFCYSRYWIHKTIKINEYMIIEEKLTSNWNGFKITQFSDIHYGKTTNENELEKIIEKINLTNPDIVIFSGDLLDSSINLSDKNIDDLKNSLKKIKARLLKLAIRGDNDYTNIDKYNEIMTTADFQILENENVLIFDKGTSPIQIGGISSLQKSDIDLKKAFVTTEQNIELKILIAHEPTIMNNLQNESIDIIFSGHSLGGLIHIPYVGGILKKEYTDNYQQGKFEKDDTIMYVSSGIGTEQYNYRFLNAPSINLYRFYNYN